MSDARPRTHLVSVGTSLLRNAAAHVQKDLSALRDSDLDNYLARETPSRVSAENNALHRELQPGDAVVLLASDTDDGERCAEALRRHLVRQGYEATAVRVPGLRAETSASVERGLRAFAGVLSDQIREAQANGRDVLVNATGGFKAQAGLATLVGALHGVPVYYIFESQDRNARLPTLPLAPDEAFLYAYGETLLSLLEPRPRADIVREVAGRTDADRFWSLLVEHADGTVELSAAGYAVADLYEPADGTSDDVARLRALLDGRQIVVVGGEARPRQVQPLREAFGNVHWESTRAHQSAEPFKPIVARPNVGVVVLLVRWASHSFGPELRALADEHGVPLVQYHGGANPQRMAYEILRQAGHRLGAP